MGEQLHEAARTRRKYIHTLGPISSNNVIRLHSGSRVDRPGPLTLSIITIIVGRAHTGPHELRTKVKMITRLELGSPSNFRAKNFNLLRRLSTCPRAQFEEKPRGAIRHARTSLLLVIRRERYIKLAPRNTQNCNRIHAILFRR